MPTSLEYATKIQSYGWPELEELWRLILDEAAGGWEPGKALEYMVLRGFQLDGATVTWPYSVTMHDEVVEQIDGAVHWDGLSCLVECKDTKTPANVSPIAKLRNQLLRRPGGTIGLLFSRSGFTAPALTLAQFLHPQTLLVWHPGDVDWALAENSFTEGLRVKYRYAVEYGLVDYSLLAEALP